MVPSSTVNVKATNSRLFSRKAVSREAIESSAGSLRSSSLRHATSASETIITSAMKPRKNGPISPSVKAWTLSRIPDRVRKVPNKVSTKVAITSSMFQVLSVWRRSCTMMECRNAVAVSHGRKLAFSTGSQAQ